MRIDQPDFKKQQDSGESQRVCSHCNKVCPTCGETSCDCQCHIGCEGIATAMVAEPERFPIEGKVVPLVYAIATIPHLQPIWSCEGHAQQSGDLLRHPQIWFYAENHQHIDEIEDVLGRLESQLHGRWRLQFSEMRNNTPVYILEAFESEDVPLEGMQSDITLLASQLQKKA